MPAPGKPDAQVQQEQMILQMSFKTKMTLQYSEMALSGNQWNMDAALKNFEELKVCCRYDKLIVFAFLYGTDMTGYRCRASCHRKLFFLSDPVQEAKCSLLSFKLSILHFILFYLYTRTPGGKGLTWWLFLFL